MRCVIIAILALQFTPACTSTTSTTPQPPSQSLDETDDISGSRCHGTIDITAGTSGHISDGCWPRYARNMYCRWKIRPNAGSLILNFSQFSLEAGYDFVNITDGMGNLLGVFTGSQIPPPVVSSTGILDIIFRSDTTSHARGFGYNTAITGFNATYRIEPCPKGCSGHGSFQTTKKTSVESGTGHRCHCDDGWWGGDCSVNRCLGTTFVAASEGAVMDMFRSYDDWNTMKNASMNLQDCRWIISPGRIDTALSLQFWKLDLEQGREFLWVYDGSGWDGTLLAQLSSNAEWSNNSLAKREVPLLRSKTGKLFLHYVSDRLASRTGFYATWTTLTVCSDACLHGKCVGEMCVCNEGWYGGDCSSRYCTGSTWLTNRTGSITDHAGNISNYQGYADCRWYIRPSVPINFITFRFTHFVLEGGLDFLYVHDGLNETAPMRYSTYIFNSTIDSAMTGDGLHRVKPLVGEVEQFVYEKHHMMLGQSTSAYMHFKSDVNDNNIDIKYPGLIDTSTYGIGQRTGFRVEYEGVFCAGITHIFDDMGSLEDGSGEHPYLPGQRCLWVLHPSTCMVPGRPRSLPLAHKDCRTTGPGSNYTNRVVELTFNVSIHNSDTLRILNGADVSAPVLQSLHDVTATNVVVTSTNHTVLIEFVTDGEHEAMGFTVSWKSIPNKVIEQPGTLAPSVWEQNLEGVPYGRPPGVDESTMCKRLTVLERLIDSITDHVGPTTTYRNNMTCQWNIQLPSYTEQIEWWVLRMDLHPGKLFGGVNISGPSQLNVTRVGPSNHTEADHVTLYKGRHKFEVWETQARAFGENETLVLANWTGHMQYVNRTPAAVPTTEIPMMVFNGSRAMLIFKTSLHYVDLGFQMRYQAVFSDPNLCEAWGRGWGPQSEADVNKAALITLRTARYVYPNMYDWRDPPLKGTKWYQTQGGAQFFIQVHQNSSYIFNGTTYSTAYIIKGSYEDLRNGYYLLSYIPHRVGKARVDVKMYGPNGLQHILGSPFTVNVRMGPTDPAGCQVIGGWDSVKTVSNLFPGKQIMFRIQAGDYYGNLRHSGDDNFVVKIDGPKPVMGVLKDMGDGTYNASFTVDQAGDYQVFVGINYNQKYEAAIAGSPFSMTFGQKECESPTCNGHGTCQDDGICDCDAAYDGASCDVEIVAPYRQVIIIENIVLGALLVVYGIYYLWTNQGSKRNKNLDDMMLADLDEDEDEEVQFKGLKCCMHW